MTKQKFLGLYDYHEQEQNKRFVVVAHGMTNLPYLVYFGTELSGHKFTEQGIRDLINDKAAEKRYYEITETKYKAKFESEK